MKNSIVYLVGLSVTMLSYLSSTGQTIPQTHSRPLRDSNRLFGPLPAPYDSDYIFTKVEILPEFPASAYGWFNFVEKNLDFEAIKVGIKNRSAPYRDSALVKFVVTKDGDLWRVTKIELLYDPRDQQLRLVRSHNAYYGRPD
jgi:hypothetical protein